MADTSEVERLKSVIIEHVAKDVLILTDNVERLTNQLTTVSNMLELLETNTVNQFDLAAKQITDFLIQQERHLAEIAESRTTQISMTVADNVEKILNTKFDSYQKSVDSALSKFHSVNVAAVDSLNGAYKDAELRIKNAASGHTSNQTSANVKNIIIITGVSVFVAICAIGAAFLLA